MPLPTAPDPLDGLPRSRGIWEAERDLLAGGISTLTRDFPVSFVRAANDELWDADGNRYVDWSGGTLTASTGHCNQRVAAAIAEQLGRLWNIHDHPSEERAQVLRGLADRVGRPGFRFQFYTTGSEAVEAALRAASSATGFRRQRVASYAEGYHGKTRGSLLAVHALYGQGVRPAHLAPLSLPFPKCFRCPYGKERLTCGLACASEHVAALEADPTVGALLFEPMLGTGGAYAPPEGYWDIVAAACSRLGILLIADEVSTGAWRTAAFLAVEWLGVQPDLIVFAKGIASGFPAMVLAGRADLLGEIGETPRGSAPLGRGDFRAPDSSSSTFGGNPLAIAAIHATLAEFDRVGIGGHVATVGRHLLRGLREIAASNARVGDVRGAGMMLAVELVRDNKERDGDPELARALYVACARAGLLLKVGNGGVVRIDPPLTHTKEHANEALAIFSEALRRVAGGLPSSWTVR